ncbi:MAG: cytochrome P450 [Parvularculales bacterium]
MQEKNLINAKLIAQNKGLPHDWFADWRTDDPVHWNPPNPDYTTELVGGALDKGFWVLTRYQDVYDVSRDQERFSSHTGGPVIWDLNPEQLAIQQAGLMGMPIHEHSQTKRLIMPPFAPKALAAFSDKITAAAAAIVDDVASLGQCEFVFDVASKLPVYTFCELMGIAPEDRKKVFKLGNELADIENRKPEHNPNEGLFELAMKVCAEKQDTPDETIMSRLLHGEVDGEKLNTLQVQMFFVTMSIAGHETTRSTLGHFLRLMHEHPDQRAILMEDLKGRLPNAIHEVLRHSPPVIKFRRTATQDTRIGDTDVKQGDKIYLSYPAANRDPAVFDDPDRFDILRPNADQHLSFGTGPHVCVGARLALMQLQSMLHCLLTRLPDIKPVGEMRYMRSIWFNAIIDMPVRFTAE